MAKLFSAVMAVASWLAACLLYAVLVHAGCHFFVAGMTAILVAGLLMGFLIMWQHRLTSVEVARTMKRILLDESHRIGVEYQHQMEDGKVYPWKDSASRKLDFLAKNILPKVVEGIPLSDEDLKWFC